MPKITEQKKTKSQPKQEEAKVNKGQTIAEKATLLSEHRSKLDPKVTVYRVFECVVHLEVALAQLKAVGIFPGPADRAESLRKQVLGLQVNTEMILKQYLEIWGEISKS